jgi:hypothetical protein
LPARNLTSLGGFLQSFTYMKEAREKMGEQFVFTEK